MVEEDGQLARTKERSVVTVGTYDGVHLGHRRLIEKTKAAARASGCRSVVVTFAEHPSTVLRPEEPVELLCTLEEKLELLHSTGVDEVVVLSFDQERAKERAEDFVRIELVERLGVLEVLVGSNFRFGHRRGGDLALLKEMGGTFGFRARGIDLVLDDEHQSVVSSSRIRALLREGEAVEAGRLLGRPYRLTGPVDERGELSVPPELLVPPPGRYLAEVDGRDGEKDRSSEPVSERVPERVTVLIEPGRRVIVEGAPRCRVVGPGRSISFLGDRETAA